MVNTHGFPLDFPLNQSNDMSISMISWIITMDIEMNRVQIPSAELGTRAMAKGTRSKHLVPAQPVRPLEPRVLNGCSV